MSQSHNPVPHTPPPLPPGFAAGPSLHAAPGQPSAGGHFNSSMGPAFPPAFEVPPGAGRPAGKTRPGRGLSRGIVAWGVAAAAAVAYLSVVVMRPDLVARFNSGGASVAEIETLRGEVDGLRRDMASVRSLVGETASQQKVIVDRLAALGAPVGCTRTRFRWDDSATGAAPRQRAGQRADVAASGCGCLALGRCPVRRSGPINSRCESLECQARTRDR